MLLKNADRRVGRGDMTGAVDSKVQQWAEVVRALERPTHGDCWRDGVYAESPDPPPLTLGLGGASVK